MRLIDIVIGGLRRRKGRMAFIVIGLAVGVGTVVALRSLTATMEQEIGAQLDQYGANIVIVPKASSQELSYGGVTLSAATFDLRQLKDEDISRIKSIKYANRLSLIAPKLLGAVEIDGQKFLLSGAELDQEVRMKQWWQVVGRVPGEKDELLVGYEAAQKLGVIEAAKPAGHESMPHSGHTSVRQPELKLLRTELTLGGEEFRVAGVLRETGAQDDQMIFAGLPTAQRVLHKPGELSLIEVSAMCNGCPIDDIVAQLSAALPDAKVSALQQAVRARLQTVERLSRFSTALSVVMLLIGFVMVFITMMNSVIERTREIGVLRALGFRKSHIIRIFMIEAALISSLGGLLGWAVGTLSGVLSSPWFTETGVVVKPPLTLALAALATAVAVGVASSLYPAIKAAKLDPTEALRYY
jgi:putative ABC transport system permease protein